MKVGDIVRVKHPEHFLVQFGNKVRERDAVVLWLGPLPTGLMAGHCGVLFKKRGNRGCEFQEVMRITDFEVQHAKAPA